MHLQQGLNIRIGKFIITIFIVILFVSCSKKPDFRGDNLINTAYSCIGKPYLYGGKNKSGFDCSGLVYYCYKSIGINLPPTTKLLRKQGKKVSGSLKLKKFEKGDLLFFRIGKIFGKSNHVGIYIGNGIMIHASPTKGVVKENLNNKYWKDRFTFSRRILKWL